VKSKAARVPAAGEQSENKSALVRTPSALRKPLKLVGNVMKLLRRKFLHLAAGAAALPALSCGASALDYPTRPVRIITGVPAGSSPDIIARLIGQWLSVRLGQQFVIENRPGANGNIGTEVVVRAPPDGYTLLLVNLANAVNQTLYDNLSFDFTRDIVPVAGIMRAPNVMDVNPSVPTNTVPEFIAYAKANPGKITMASAGSGSSSHLAGELFKMMTGVDLVHVPYRGGGPALIDLLGGQVQMTFGTMPVSIEHIRAGELRALAVTSALRTAVMPDVPAVGEFVPGYEASAWYGIGASKNTPADIVDRLNNEINAGLADSQIKARLADLGGGALNGSPTAFGKLIAQETEKWAKVVKFARIKPE
jgi:tripartite-type tricarboxylate transporter receptor subunit TctC